MKNKDFTIYREGYLEGYDIGLKDGGLITFSIKNRIFFYGFLLGIIFGIGVFVIGLIYLKLGGFFS